MVQKFWSNETAAVAIEYRKVAAGFPRAIAAIGDGSGIGLNTAMVSINRLLN